MNDCHEPNCRCHRFRDRVAIVTGAASGIGRACALAFAAERARLAVCDVSMEGLEGARQSIEEAGAECLAMHVDVREQSEAESFIQATLDRFGTIDILVNNAGTGQFVPFAFVENEEYDRVMDINARGTFFSAAPCCPP